MEDPKTNIWFGGGEGAQNVNFLLSDKIWPIKRKCRYALHVSQVIVD